MFRSLAARIVRPFALLLGPALTAVPLLAFTAPPAAAQLSVLINPGDQGEQSRQAGYQTLRVAVADALREARFGEANWAISIDATADLAGTRSQLHDLYVAPAHVIGSALRNGYVPLVGQVNGAQAVLVTTKDRGITSLAQAAGKRLGLPMPDSIVTYLVRGELNAANTSQKSHFSRVQHLRYQDALLVCLQLRECDVVGVERAVFDRWQAGGESLVVLMESRPAAGLSVAIRQKLAADGGARALQAALLRAFATPAVARVGIGAPETIAASEFTYVSTLGYFTPRQLPGAKVIDAPTVAQLMSGGAQYIDVRTDAEFKNGRVPGSRLVPYVEKSAKDTDYDARLDSFDLTKLPADRNAALIFACNGAECWKSYKASHVALKAGYRNVHWFRGGFPEWRSSTDRQIASGDV